MFLSTHTMNSSRRDRSRDGAQAATLVRRAHQQGVAVEASSPHGEIQVVDQRDVSAQQGRGVVPDQGHCEGPPCGGQAELVRLP